MSCSEKTWCQFKIYGTQFHCVMSLMRRSTHNWRPTVEMSSGKKPFNLPLTAITLFVSVPDRNSHMYTQSLGMKLLRLSLLSSRNLLICYVKILVAVE
jgi:hypothetical protein